MSVPAPYCEPDVSVAMLPNPATICLRHIVRLGPASWVNLGNQSSHSSTGSSGEVGTSPPGSLGLLSMFLPRGAVFQTIENPGYWPPDARLWHRNMGQFWGHIYSQYYNYTEKEKEQSGGLLGAEIDIMLDSENLAQHLDSALVRMTENSELPASEISEINLAEEELEI